MQRLNDIKSSTFNALHAIARGSDAGLVYADDAKFWCSHPFNENVGLDHIRAFWRAMHHAFPDMERRDSIFVAGDSIADPRTPQFPAGRQLVAAMGHFQATFEHDFCGIPATRGVVHLRFGEVHHIVAGKIVHTWALIDLLDLMRQAGVWPIAPSLGAEGMWPGPASGNGVATDRCDAQRGEAAMRIVLSMHAALGAFDGKRVASMPYEPYWTKNFMWYGPSGIGATRGIKGFRAHHQVPFLLGFPDRKGVGHFVRIGDGDYAVTGGWPSVSGTHLGEWLGLPGTGRKIDLRIMDFYRVDGDRIAENWVPIDVIDMLRQMGFDIFERLARLRGAPRLDL
ncbi:MAG: ester cyclase [Parvularculaceae bacterium]|nr:ester cyclase [Parvularculaceae bacterium]